MGGNSSSGIDCSAFVQQVFSAAGKSISRTTWSQYAETQRISSPSVGDLVFSVMEITEILITLESTLEMANLLVLNLRQVLLMQAQLQDIGQAVS